MTQYIYEQSGRAVGFVRGKYIHAMNGTAVGQLRGTHVHKLSGSYVGDLEDDMILDKRHARGAAASAMDAAAPENVLYGWSVQGSPSQSFGCLTSHRPCRSGSVVVTSDPAPWRRGRPSASRQRSGANTGLDVPRSAA
jgi:hypothetical protein